MSLAFEPRPALPTRRNVLRWISAAGLLGAGGGLSARAAARGLGGGAPDSGGRKLLTVFLRGGNDGVNTLIPLHDAEYFAPGVRPTLKIPLPLALDLGNGGAAFHPSLARALEVFHAGELAAAARIGTASSSLSHFSSQRFLETGVPGDDDFAEGWVARWARLEAGALALPAASVSSQVQRLFLGPRVVGHIPDLDQYAPAPDPVLAKILGSGASGLAGAYAATGGPGYDALVRETGAAMQASLAALATLPPAAFAADAFPADPSACGAHGLPPAWWAATFFANVRDALRLLLGTECAVAGVELPGFDHHVGQGGAGGDHAARLSVVAHALRSLRREALAAGAWDELAVLVISEFGRASRENGSGGTDHGRSGVVLLAGGRVLGGVHHCDPVSWPAGATLFSSDGRYVEHRTDVRAVFAEVLERHLGVAPAVVDQVLPGYASLTGPAFQSLGLFL